MADTKKKQQLVFTMEYIIEIETAMAVNVEGVLEKMQENGNGAVIKVEVR